MEENLKWLWYAFGTAWVLHVLYLGSLLIRTKKLEQQLQTLKALIEENDRKTYPSFHQLYIFLSVSLVLLDRFGAHHHRRFAERAVLEGVLITAGLVLQLGN